MWYQSYPQRIEFHSLPFYAAGIGRHDRQYPIYRPEGLPRHQFLYASKGSGVVRYGGNEVRIEPMSGFYLPPNESHEYYPLEKVWNIRWLSCGGDGVESLCRNMQPKPGHCYALQEVKPLDRIIDQMRQTALPGRDSDYYLAFSHINEFIITFCLQAGILEEKPIEKKELYSYHQEMLEAYIGQNYMRDITLEELCELVAVSPQHLCRIFQRCLGQRPMEYVNSVRLMHVREYLEGSSYPVGQIAEWCGFRSAGYMGKVFHRETGMSPREYRSRFHERE